MHCPLPVATNSLASFSRTPVEQQLSVVLCAVRRVLPACVPGWAAADALLMRTFPILSGAWAPQFDMGHVISAVQANVFIVSVLVAGRVLCQGSSGIFRVLLTVSLLAAVCS